MKCNKHRINWNKKVPHSDNKKKLLKKKLNIYAIHPTEPEFL